MKLLEKIKQGLDSPVALFFIRLVVGGVYVLFGYAKAIQPHEVFYTSIREYQLLPEAIVPFFGSTLIYVELIIGALFVLGLFTRFAAWGITGTLMMFMAALTQAIIRGLDMPNCGCAGDLVHLGNTPVEVLLRNIALFIPMLWFLRSKVRSAFALDTLLESSSSTEEPTQDESHS